MLRSCLSLLLALAFAMLAMFVAPQAFAEPISIADMKHDGDVDFEREILPIFRRNCLACHSATEAQSDLVLESPPSILKGGSEGPSVVAGKSAESLLLKLAAKQKEPHMPPPDNDVQAKPLTPQELGLIKLWIDQGAKGELKGAAQISWQSLPAGINPIYAVAIDAGGQFAAAARANQIFMYHVPSKREVGRLTDPSLLERGLYQQPGVADLDLVQSLKFSPDAALLVSGGFRTVKLWRRSVVADESRLPAVTEIKFGPDGGFTAKATDGGAIRIAENATGNDVKSLDHGAAVAALAASADGKRLVSAGTTGPAKLWDVEAGKQIAELQGDIRATLQVGQATRAVALAKKQIDLAKKDEGDATTRKKAEEDNKSKAAEALTKAETEFKSKEAATQKAAAEKAAAEKTLADAIAAKTKADEAKKGAEEVLAKAGDAVKSIKSSQEAAGKIDTDDGRAARVALENSLAEVESLRKLLEPHKLATDKAAEQAASSQSDADKKAKELVATAQKAADDQTTAQRTLETAKRGVQRAEEAVKKAMDALPSLAALVKAAEDAVKAREEDLAKATADSKAGEKPMSGVGFSPDGLVVITASADGTIYTWDAASGAALEVIGGAPGPGLVPANVTIEWQLERTLGSPDDASNFADRLTALDFSPDGKLLAVGGGEPSRSGEIKLFNSQTGELALTLKEPHSDTVNCLAFSPDGKQLASCGADRFVKLWNVADGKFIRSFEGHTHHVLGVSWRADGRMLVSSGADLVLKVWDTRTGDQLRTVQNQFTKEVTSVNFLADGDLVVASGGDAKVRLINATSGNNQRDLSGPAEYMYAAAASADGKTIIAGGLDSIVRLWNDQGQELAKFAAPSPPQPQTAAK